MADHIGPLADTLPPPPCAAAIKAARAKLKPIRHRTSVWSLLGAAALFAGSGVALAAAVILGPPQLATPPAAAPVAGKAPPVMQVIPHAVAVPES